MNQDLKSRLGRLWDSLIDLLPNGRIGDDGPLPIDGRRDTNNDYRRAVLKARSQMSSGGQATTSYEPADRGNARDD